ncbi:MAG: CysS/YqeB C-terminal domain-containing protein, partial [Acidimicrobiales bacterium]
LDLLAEAGLRAAVIPHYNNAEGGNHDTRFCYLGQRRLSAMEEALEGGAFVLGVDEHTGLVLDLDAGQATVVGLGVVTLRARGRSQELPTGTTLPIAELGERASSLAAGESVGSHRSTTGTRGGAPTAAPAPDSRPGSSPESPPDWRSVSPLLGGVRERQASFSAAVGRRDVEGAVRAVLELDGDLVAWSRDTLESDELDRGRDALHAMVAALGQLADVGIRDPRETLGPFVEALLDQRGRARAERRFDQADQVRDALTSLGVEIRDTPGGTEWLLAGDHRPAPPGPDARPR